MKLRPRWGKSKQLRHRESGAVAPSHGAKKTGRQPPVRFFFAANAACTSLGNCFECGAKRGCEEPKQQCQETSGDQRNSQEVWSKERVGRCKTRNQYKEPDRGKLNPATSAMWNHRGDRIEPHAARNSGKLAGIAHRNAKQKDNREGIMPLAHEFFKRRFVPPPAQRIFSSGKWRGLFGKNASPTKGQWNRRAEI